MSLSCLPVLVLWRLREWVFSRKNAKNNEAQSVSVFAAKYCGCFIMYTFNCKGNCVNGAHCKKDWFVSSVSKCILIMSNLYGNYLAFIPYTSLIFRCGPQAAFLLTIPLNTLRPVANFRQEFLIMGPSYAKDRLLRTYRRIYNTYIYIYIYIYIIYVSLPVPVPFKSLRFTRRRPQSMREDNTYVTVKSLI